MKKIFSALCTISLLAFSSASLAEPIEFTGFANDAKGIAMFNGNSSKLDVSKWTERDLDRMKEKLDKIASNQENSAKKIEDQKRSIEQLKRENEKLSRKINELERKIK